ncbi:MAG: ZIP family metal transporter [Nanoarchaeota archaeon]|nr:ZIP family metal transporter [Nanoarchaeota archaeon]
MDSIYLILGISIAGPILGSLIGVLKKPSENFMFNMLSFAAGVMLAISFLELLPESIHLSSTLLCVIGILLGAVVMYLLDKLIPHIHPAFLEPEQGQKCSNNLSRVAIYLLFGIFLHNFPEGMAIATGTVTGSALILAIAIAIHNIPEGICTSAPYYFCSKKRLKSFLISSTTAIPIALGFLIARVLFQNISSNIIGIIVAGTAGVMIYISADELIPCSCGKKNTQWSHSTIFSLLLGVVFVVLLGSL